MKGCTVKFNVSEYRVSIIFCYCYTTILNNFLTLFVCNSSHFSVANYDRKHLKINQKTPWFFSAKRVGALISLSMFILLQWALRVAGDGKCEHWWSSCSAITISTAECAEYWRITGRLYTASIHIGWPVSASTWCHSVCRAEQTGM